VYEKGVPPVTTEAGFLRALALFLELIPGATVASALISHGTNGVMPTIPLSLERVNALIGKEIPKNDVIRILENLDCHVVVNPESQNLKAESVTVTPPLHRMRDLQGAHDLIEEIGRIYGYDRIENVMPMAELRIPERDQRMHKMRDQLRSAQYFETVPLSFLSEQQFRKAGFDPAHAIRIENPLGDDTALLQTSTLPALLIHAEKNLLATGTLRTFHWSHVFGKDTPEHLELSMLISTRDATDLLHDPFLQTKESMITALHAAGYTVTIAPTKNLPAYAHPGRIADVMFGKEIVGQIFEVHPTIRSTFNIPGRAAATIINLHALLKHEPKVMHAEPLPLFPSVIYDVTFTRTHDKHIAALLEKAEKASDLLESVVVHDLYQKSGSDTYNATLRFTYRSAERTLTEDEAKKAHDVVLKAIN
jgi:phenylalanyl-tRNA synthetase beta chain